VGFFPRKEKLQLGSVARQRGSRPSTGTFPPASPSANRPLPRYRAQKLRVSFPGATSRFTRRFQHLGKIPPLCVPRPSADIGPAALRQMQAFPRCTACALFPVSGRIGFPVTVSSCFPRLVSNIALVDSMTTSSTCLLEQAISDSRSQMGRVATKLAPAPKLVLRFSTFHVGTTTTASIFFMNIDSRYSVRTSTSSLARSRENRAAVTLNQGSAGLSPLPTRGDATDAQLFRSINARLPDQDKPVRPQLYPICFKLDLAAPGPLRSYLGKIFHEGFRGPKGPYKRNSLETKLITSCRSREKSLGGN